MDRFDFYRVFFRGKRGIIQGNAETFAIEMGVGSGLLIKLSQVIKQIRKTSKNVQKPC